MSFTENPRSALCSAGVCCGTCGVEAELEAYAPLVRSVAIPRRRPPTARKSVNRSGGIPLRLLFAVSSPFLSFRLSIAALCVVLLAFLYS